MSGFKFESQNLCVLQWRKGESYIEIAKGKSKDKNTRGSTKSKDKLKGRKKLYYQGLEAGVHRFKDHTDTVDITVEERDGITRLHLSGAKGYNRLWFSLHADKDEHIYGCGEQFTHVDLKGQRVRIWVSEHHSVKKLVKKYLREKFKGVNYDHIGPYKEHASYHAQPTFISSKRYGLHTDSTAFATFDFKESETVLSFREIPSTLYLFKADDFLALSGKLKQLIGTQTKLPGWTEEGIILAMQGGEDVIKDKIAASKACNMPVVGVWAQDWSGQVITKFGSQVYWNWTTDQARYQHLRALIKTLNADDIKFLGYINPFFKEDSPQFNEAKDLGYLVKNKKGQPYLVKSTTFKAGMIDLTCENAYDYMKKIIKDSMIGIGMSGWMADFGEYIPSDAYLAKGKGDALHNLYPALWAQCNHEAIKESQADCFFFSRAAYTDTLKFTNAMWVGDQHVDYSDQEGLGSVIPAFISMATSGVGINHSDIGGYTTIFHMKRDKELLIRWAELALFTPLFRTHEGNLPQANVQYDHQEVEPYIVSLSRSYKALAPYLKAMKKAYYTKGIPVIRPLFYHVDEPFAYTTKRMFMYGSDILVAPVLRPGVINHKVTLPYGTWVHLFTKEVFQGGTHVIKSPLGVPCAFYPKDSQYKDLFASLTL